MFKTLNNMGPNCLKELFTFKKEILNHTFAQAKYKQYEKEFHVRWSFHMELSSKKNKRE